MPSAISVAKAAFLLSFRANTKKDIAENSGHQGFIWLYFPLMTYKRRPFFFYIMYFLLYNPNVKSVFCGRTYNYVFLLFSFFYVFFLMEEIGKGSGLHNKGVQEYIRYHYIDCIKVTILFRFKSFFTRFKRVKKLLNLILTKQTNQKQHKKQQKKKTYF